MRVVLAWLQLDLRRRWRSLVVLAVLIAVSGGTVMTAFAGAHRGSTSYERLAERTLPVDAMVLPNTSGFDWEPFRDLDYVEAVSEFALGASPAFEGGITQAGVDFLHADDEFGTTMEKPIVFEGRQYDFGAPDEAMMSPAYAETYDLAVGDVLTARLPSPGQADSIQDELPYDQLEGPRVDITIVGIVRSPWYMDLPGRGGGLLMSPALFTQYRDNFMGAKGDNTWLNAQFRLKNGAADVAQLRRDVERITGRSDIDVFNLGEEESDLQRNLDFEGRCLLVFGLAALLAGLFLVGQAIARYAAAETSELRTGRALGMTPRQTIVTAAAGPFLASVIGVGLAIGASVAASTWFPIGTASGIEPTPGVAVDAVVLGAVALAVVALASAGAATSAALSLRASSSGAPRRSPVASAVARTGAPVPVLIGTRFALERGLGRTSVPVLPALVGAVAGVLGVVAAFSFSHAVDDAINHPERFGQTYQAFAFAGFNGRQFLPVDEMADVVRSLDYVTGVDRGRVGTAGVSGGEASVDLWSYDTGKKSLPTVVTQGRMPESQDEVLLSPGMLQRLDTSIGDTIKLTGSRATHELMIVGAGFVPTGPHNTYNTGGFVTAHGYDGLFDDFKFSVMFVSVDGSARDDGLTDRLTSDVAAALPDLSEAGPLFSDPAAEGLDVSAATGQLDQIRALPLALGVFLALLAIGAVGHAIATATRRRAHDLAVLRATGLTPWQSRGVIATQATVLVLVGVVFGLPLGLAVGRSVWRLVADFTPLQYVPPTAVLVLALVGPVALLMAYLVAVWPAMRSSGFRIAHVLRAE